MQQRMVDACVQSCMPVVLVACAAVPFTVHFGACRKCHTFSLVDGTQPKSEEKWDDAVVPNAAQGMSRGLAPKLVPQSNGNTSGI